jgi:DNA-binding CsgD family transcriptional regulator
MKQGAALENLTGAIIGACESGLSPAELREQVLSRLRRAVPFDAAFWTTVDPATLLFTQPHQDQIPPETIPYFVQNEFLEEDVNKWTALAREEGGVRTLVQATGGEIDASSRYRDIFRPLGLGDELRAVLRAGGVCWGLICLHRENGVAFSGEEMNYVRRIAPHIAEGIRAGFLIGAAESSDVAEGPGLLVIATDGSLVSVTSAGTLWLEELGHPDPVRHGLPMEVQVLAARAQDPRFPGEVQPRLHLRTPAGRWAVLHASVLPGDEGTGIAVIIDEPSPAELSPILMLAYGLTERERTVTAHVCRGLSTKEISARLHITQNTVQDHLKSIFEKTGVGSRRELVATILQEQYLPRAMSGTPVGPGGFFTA